MAETNKFLDERMMRVGILPYAMPQTKNTPIDRWVLLILIVGLAIRLLFSSARPVNQESLTLLPDQLEYLGAGNSIWFNHGFSCIEFPLLSKVYAFRMPGYPLLIAGCRASWRAVCAVQAVLDTSSALAMCLVASRLIGQRSGRLAAALVVFNPYLVYFASLLLSETLFTACLAWGMVLVLNPRARWQWFGITLLLLSVYTRPSAIGLGVVTAAATHAIGFDTRKICKGLMAIFASGAMLAALLLPWAMRNHRVLNQWVWTTTNSGYTAYDSFNPIADGSSNQAFFRNLNPPSYNAAAQRAADDRVRAFSLMDRDEAEGLSRLTDLETLRAMSEVDRSQAFIELAWRYASTHPARVVTLAFAKLGRFWSPIPLSADFGGRWLYVIVGGLYVVPLFVFAAIGIFRGGLGRRATLILLLPAIYFSAVHCVFVGSLRYRVPCDVPLAVLAAAGVMSFVRPKGIESPAVAK